MSGWSRVKESPAQLFWRKPYRFSFSLSAALQICNSLAVIVSLDFDETTVLNFHFTMGCGNDNMMGVFSIPETFNNEVPEPTTMLLFGAGLAGLEGMGESKRNNSITN